MRDTSDMMEDTLSEDTMMDCGGDGGGLEDLVELATDIADSSPTIQDAAERLLTLLGMDDNNEDFLSSSEDEGVEVDVDDEEDEEPENTRLLHQLAASLAQELKYSQQKHNQSAMRIPLQGRFETRNDQSLEMIQDASFHDQSRLQGGIGMKDSAAQCRESDYFDQARSFERTKRPFGCFYQDSQETVTVGSFQSKVPTSDNLGSSGIMFLDRCLRMDDVEEVRGVRSISSQQQDENVAGSWASGWDACATEAVRYLVENEGLPLHHPTVLAMKNHLDLQRERAYARYTT